jgi:type I restriction enzyme S subunit
MSEWPTINLGEAVKVKHGFAFKGENFSDVGPGPVLVTPGNFTAGARFRTHREKYYLGQVPQGYELHVGDLIVTMTDLSKNGDTLGFSALVPSGHRYLHNQRIGLVEITRPDLVDRNFLYYLMRTAEYRNHIISGATGSTVRHTNPTRICEYSTTFPAVKEQRIIAALLGALDDKISINDRISSLCATLASARFSADVWDSDSTLHLREGYRYGSVDDLCVRVGNGGTPKRSIQDYWVDGNIPWFKTGELADAPLIEAVETISVRGLSESSCSLWPAGTVLVALYASPTVGRLGILEKDSAFNQACSALEAKPDIGPFVLFETLKATRKDLQKIAVGAAQQNISQAVLRAHTVVVPPREVTLRYHETAKKLHQRRVAAMKESHHLAELRDALLPKLMSGEIRIRDAEKVGEDVT